MHDDEGKAEGKAAPAWRDEKGQPTLAFGFSIFLAIFNFSAVFYCDPSKVFESFYRAGQVLE